MAGKAALRASMAAALTLAAGALVSCSSSDSPTSPEGMTSTLSGTVVSGVGPGGLHPMAGPVALSNVTVRVDQTGATAVTDHSGAFQIARVPSGPVDLSFERADVHARGNVVVPAGANAEVTVSIVGSKAVITGRGHAGAEIEGIVASVNASGLVVNDQRLGSVTINVTATTVIRHGNTTVALSSIAAGNRVHVKAMQETNGTYTATDVNVQNQGTGNGANEVSGTILSVDAVAKSFVVDTGSGSVTVTTSGTTKYKKNGAAAAFADLAAGQTVDVEGSMQAGGTFLAEEVEIEG